MGLRGFGASGLRGFGASGEVTGRNRGRDPTHICTSSVLPDLKRSPQVSTVAPFVAVSTTVRPNRRPPRPKHPKFTQFHRSGLHFGRIHPQHRQYGDSSKAYGDCQSVRGRRQGLAGHRKRRTDPHHSPQPHRCGGRRRVRRAGWPDNEPTRPATHSDTAPPVWRAPEGPEGQGGLRGAAPNEVRSPSLAGGRTRRHLEYQRGLAAVPVGGGGAWPDNEPTRRAKHAARTARGRADPHQSPRPHRCGGRRRDRRARAGFEARRRTK